LAEDDDDDDDEADEAEQERAFPALPTMRAALSLVKPTPTSTISYSDMAAKEPVVKMRARMTIHNISVPKEDPSVQTPSEPPRKTVQFAPIQINEIRKRAWDEESDDEEEEVDEPLLFENRVEEDNSAW
jgi:hypothetical protein